MIYVDEMVYGCILGGVLILVLVGWAAWAAAWVRRVELRAAAEPLVREFGLAWLDEGLRMRVGARGRVEQREVELRVGLPVARPVFRARIGGGRWEALDRDQPAAALRDRLAVSSG